MRVLITGASGNLGSGLVERLAGRHALRLADLVPVETTHEFVQLDVRQAEQYLDAAAGVDLIVHTPAWHGIHLRTRNEREFWELNVDGTFNLFQAAVAHRVPRVIWISSVAVHNRDNIYGLSKIVGEELCQFYWRVHGIRCIMLRPADFTPYRDRKHYGERLLLGGVDRRDVHQAAALAVDNDTITCAAFPVLRADPWTPDEVELWHQDPLAVLEHYVPQARQLVATYGLQLPEQIAVPDISATRSALGYQPEYNFVSFLRELAEREQAGDAATWLAQAG
jgi:nucleoside-diphosphate-sugar epimerase